VDFSREMPLEIAKQELQGARADIALTDPNDPLNRYRLHVARALTEMATALADIYDKLAAIDKKLSR
jgi:hypothetical protein